MNAHAESISVAVRNSVGKLVMECVIETKTSTILQFIDFSGKTRIKWRHLLNGSIDLSRWLTYPEFRTLMRSAMQ